MTFTPPTFRPGDALPARHLNDRNRELLRLGALRGSAGAVARPGAGGRQLARVRRETIYARLTGTADGDGGYPWREVYPAPLGTWVLSDRTGSAEDDPAFELQHNVDLAAGDDVFEMTRDRRSGRWLFDADCGECGIIAGCCPNPLAETLYLHSPLGVHPIAYQAPVGTTSIWSSDCLLIDTIGVFFDGGSAEESFGVAVESPLTWVLACQQLGDDWYWSLEALTKTLFLGSTSGSVSPVHAFPFGGEYQEGDGPCVFEGEGVGLYNQVNLSEEECADCSPVGLQFLFSLAAGDLGEPASGGDAGIFALMGFGNTFANTAISFPVFITDSPDPPAVETDVCVTARTCKSPGGSVIPDAEVVLKKPDGTTVGTCTTGMDGRCCIPVTHAGGYRAEVTVGDCTVTVPVMVGICDDGDVEVEAVVCCARACVRVKDSVSGANLSGSTVSLIGHPDVVTGADGKACFDLTAAEMMSFGVGSACTSRLVGPFTVGSPIEEITGSTHLSRCEIYIEVDCGEDQTESPEDVELVPFPPGTTQPDPELESPCCGPDDCTVPGPSGRGLVYTQLSVVFNWQFFDGFTGNPIPGPGYGPQSWSGLMTLDSTLFQSTGQQDYTSGCINITDFSIFCDEELYGISGVTWRALSLKLELCRGGVGRLIPTFHVNSACGESAGSNNCPDCDSGGLDIRNELDLDQEPAEGSETDHLCWEEFIDGEFQVGGGGTGSPCIIVMSFTATGYP